MKAQSVLEIEVDSEFNDSLLFEPLKKRVRGSYDVHRAAQHDRDTGELFKRWPEPIPGQRLALDVEKRQGKLIEPLREERYAATAEKVKRFAKLAPAETVFDNVDVATWQHWMKLAVHCNLAKVTAGELPDKLDGTPKLKLPAKDQSLSLTEALDRQTSALERQASAIEKLVAHLAKNSR